MSDTVNETTVSIGGSSFQLRTDLDKEEITRIAAYVDSKMRELDPRSSLPPNKLSVLTSLTIASELFEIRDKANTQHDDMESRLKRLQDLLDEALHSD